MSQLKKKPIRTPVPKSKKTSRKKGATKTSPKSPGPKSLPFQPEIRVYPSPDALVQETAHQVMQLAREAVNARGRFVAALSGGTTPKGLFQQLTEEPYRSLVPWEKSFFFWVDERHVPLTHETSNFRMTQEYLLSKLPDRKSTRLNSSHLGIS